MTHDEMTELFSDDFSAYPLCERMESPAAEGEEWDSTPLLDFAKVIEQE